MQAKFLSDHSSNPLQARPSDRLNNQYVNRYNKAVKNGHIVPSDEDELNQWTPQEGSVVVRSPEREPKRYVDLDTVMSDDEIGIKKRLKRPRTIDPRKEFNVHVQDTTKNEEYGQEDEEQSHYSEPQGDEDEHSVMEDDIDAIGESYDEDQDDYESYALDMDEDTDDPFNSPLTPSTPSSAFSSPQSSRPPSPDESTSLYSRPEDEQVEIQSEINSLYRAVPELKGKYQLLDRLGTGTFSSVYKAIDLLYDEWDNQPWLGHHLPESSAFYQSVGPGYKGRGGRGTSSKKRSAVDNDDVDMDATDEANIYRYYPKDGKVYVAIKRIYTTSSPDRIKNELRVLEICRGCRHTSQVITAFRHLDQVLIVFPYHRNLDFREFYQNLHPEGIKCYFRCLFRALRDIHLRGIIHRDVKPANFLYDPFTGIGTLCDFGLASRMKLESKQGSCIHSESSPDTPHGRNFRIADHPGLTELLKAAQKDARTKSMMPAEKVGYPENDKRPISKANRAGTRGFRAPEVLFKCNCQTGAIDVWSAGIILLCFLTGKFPIFNSNDDIEALMEIAVIIGKKKIERVATIHGRMFATNVPDLQQDGISWEDFAKKLNPKMLIPPKYDMRYYPHNSKHRDGRLSSTATAPQNLPPTSSPPEPSSDLTVMETNMMTTLPTKNASTTSDKYMNPPPVERHEKEMGHALDLLELMLHYESTKRITPNCVLDHLFLAEPGASKEPDDAFVANNHGGGVCCRLHQVDDETEQMSVKVLRRYNSEDEDISLDRKVLVDSEGEVLEDIEDEHGKLVWGELDCIPGQGIAIGFKPCELHQDPLYERWMKKPQKKG